MEKVRIYFIEITDTNDVKHRLKTDKLLNKDKLKEILGDGD